MKIDLILWNYEKEKSFFELAQGIRPWGILLMISKGEFSVTLKGKTETFSPFEIAYIPSNTEFYREIISPIDFHQFAFYCDKDDQICQKMRCGKLHIPKDQVKAIIESAERLSELYEADGIAEHILERIITENYLFGKGNDEYPQKTSHEIAKITEIIRSNIKEKIDISKLASVVGLSNAGLILKFKKELSMTPSDYIVMHRMKLAKRLLLETDISISQISEMCGYSNAYYFSNAFLKNVGMRPSEYRKKTGTE